MDSRRKRDGYQQFPNLHYRNVLQERIEVPAPVRLLDLPRGRRMLEIGCGRGVACPHSPLCEPSRLAGLDIDPAVIARLISTCRSAL